MSLDDPAVITCAISGAIANRDQCPAIPYTPAEYGAEARRIVDEGGVHIHIHARSPDGAPSYEIEDFVAIKQAILDEVGDAAIINFSTGTIGVPVAKRVAYLEAGLPEVAALNMGSMNYAKWNVAKQQFAFNFVFANSFDDIVAFARAMKEHGIKPEMECFDVGHTNSHRVLVDLGLLAAPFHFSFIMGVLGGIPASARHLAFQAEQVPAGSRWKVIGISREQWPLAMAALSLGGDVRVGLEDNFYLPNGDMATSNGELVASAAELVKLSGRRVASVDDAKKLLWPAA